MSTPENFNGEKKESETIKGFDRPAVKQALEEALVLHRNAPVISFGNHQVEVTNRYARSRGFSAETAQHFLRAISALAHERKNLKNEARKKRQAVVETAEKRRILKDMREVAALRGDEGIPDEEIFEARK